MAGKGGRPGSLWPCTSPSSVATGDRMHWATQACAGQWGQGHSSKGRTRPLGAQQQWQPASGCAEQWGKGLCLESCHCLSFSGAPRGLIFPLVAPLSPLPSYIKGNWDVGRQWPIMNCMYIMNISSFPKSRIYWNGGRSKWLQKVHFTWEI